MQGTVTVKANYNLMQEKYRILIRKKQPYGQYCSMLTSVESTKDNDGERKQRRRRLQMTVYLLTC